MDVVEMLIRSQGSQNISELGRQFGLAASDDSLASLARELQGGQYARYANEPADPQLNDATQAGNQILEQIFGSKDVSRGVANQAADLSGIGSAILKKMLPVIAAMIIGNLTKGMIGGGASAPAPRREASSGGLDDMLKDVLGRGQQSAPREAQGQGGGGLGDILGDILGGGGAGGSGGGGLGDILGDILGGGGGGASPDPARNSEAIRRGRASLDDVLGRGTQSGNAADDLLRSVERMTRR
ncbi:MAG: DUF937 domain-containing protein [Rhizobiales bacterium]|nr:DUF937 domain-containing protein [Hyphomicrobiales bacterium]